MQRWLRKSTTELFDLSIWLLGACYPEVLHSTYPRPPEVSPPIIFELNIAVAVIEILTSLDKRCHVAVRS